MRVAIFLTGQIQHRYKVIPHIKQMFSALGNRYGLTIDYYCHFWETQNKYFYYVDDNAIEMKLPSEDSRNKNKVLSLLDPGGYVCSSYDELLPYYKIMASNRHKYLSDGGHLHINLVDNKFTNTSIHERVFLNEYENPPQSFMEWYNCHVDWCKFVHVTNQIFSASKCMNMIVQSSNEYDVVLKWRYDLVFDYHNYGNMLYKIIRSSANRDGYHTEIAWKGIDWSEPYKTVEDILPDDVVSLGDVWWATNQNTNRKMAGNLLNNYVDNVLETPEHVGGQHTWIYDAIVRSMGIPIHLHGKLRECIIRNPSTLNNAFHDGGIDFETLMDNNIRAEPHSEYMRDLRYWDEQSIANVKDKFILY